MAGGTIPFFPVCILQKIRQQYFKYLERQLNENYCTWKQHQDAHEPSHNDQKLDQGSHLSFIRRTAELLEDKALQACMIAQFYQRAMIQIVSIEKILFGSALIHDRPS